MTEGQWLSSDDPAAMLRSLELPDDLPQGPSRMPSDRKLRLFACACYRTLPGFAHWDADGDARWCVEAGEAMSDGLPLPLLGGAIVDLPADVSRVGVECQCYCTHTDPLLAARMANVSTPGVSPAHKAALFRDIVGNPRRLLALCGVPNHGYAGVTIRPWCDGCQAIRTLTVLALAHAAYNDRPGRKCEACEGGGRVSSDKPFRYTEDCTLCHGTGRVEDGLLCPDRIAVLADALLDAGCPELVPAPCPRCSPHLGHSGGVPGYHPERDPASGRHEGGWTNCKACNANGNPRPGFVRAENPLLDHLRDPGPHVRGCWALDLISGKS